MGINVETAKKAEHIAKKLAKPIGMPVELLLTEAYQILRDESIASAYLVDYKESSA